MRRLLIVAVSALLVAGGTTAAAEPRPADRGGPHRPGDWSTWQKDLTGSRFNAAEHRLTPATVGGLKLKWAFSYPAVPGSHPRSQPAVVGDTVYFGSPDGKFHARDARTGAARWTFDLGTVTPGSVVRDGPAVAAGKVFFGGLGGHLYALDQRTGKLAWTRQLDTHPAALVTSSPLYFAGRIYVGVSSGDNVGDIEHACCTFRGHVDAIDARTGALAWRYYTVPPPRPVGTWPSGATRYEPSGAGVWSSPVIDRRTRTLYVGTGQNYTGSAGDFDSILALDTGTGAVRWKQRMNRADTWRLLCADPTAPPGYCPGINDGTALDYDLGAMPNLFRVRGRLLVGIGQKSGVYHVFDARTGRIIWQRQLSVPMPNGGLSGVQWGASYDGRRLYVATYLAGPGTLFGLDPATGAIHWQTPNPADGCSWGGASAHPDLCQLGHGQAVTTSPGVVYLGSTDGKVRAYSAATGAVLWQYDTVRDFAGVNGLPGRGGALSGGGGPVVAHGMVYAQSGYWLPEYPTDKGYVLLAFGL
jgi:polyvinyl alcohol dehydrogenase (cytochrome)